MYKVVHPDRDGRYALKRLKNLRRRDRFAREVTEMQRLWEGGLRVIPPVVEADVEGDHPYFVMPWYSDGSLEERVSQGAYRGDVRGVELLIGLAQTVGQVHLRGMAHRDLKPANVLLDGDTVLLSDFGLTLQVDDDAERLTALNEAVGSRLYVAPENESGFNDQLDQRPADFYAFGKIVWAVLAGSQPPARELHREQGQRLQDVLQDARFQRLAPLLDRLANRDPRARLRDWTVVVRELEVFRSVLLGEAPPVPRARPALADGVEASQRLAEVPALRELRDRTVAARQDREWLDRLVSALRAGVIRVAEEPLRELNEESTGVFMYAVTAAGIHPSDLRDPAGDRLVLPPGEPFIPELSQKAPVFIHGYSPIGAQLDGVAVGVYVFKTDRDFVLLRVGFMRRNSAVAQGKDELLFPRRLFEALWAESERMPLFLEQAIVGAESFGAETAAAFIEVAAEHNMLLAEEADPASRWD